MSKESKKLAENVLDSKREFPFAIVTAMGVVAIAVVSYMTGKFPTSALEDSYIATNDVSIIEKIDGANILERLSPKIITPTGSGTVAIPPSAVTLFNNRPLVMHPSASYYCIPDSPEETVESIVQEYSSCIRYTNTEMDGDYYRSFKYTITDNCPSLQPKAKQLLQTNNMITYIDFIEMGNECDIIRQAEVKAQLTATKINTKKLLLE